MGETEPKGATDPRCRRMAVVQDRDSSIIYGMPQAALALAGLITCRRARHGASDQGFVRGENESHWRMNGCRVTFDLPHRGKMSEDRVIDA